MFTQREVSVSRIVSRGQLTIPGVLCSLTLVQRVVHATVCGDVSGLFPGQVRLVHDIASLRHTDQARPGRPGEAVERGGREEGHGGRGPGEGEEATRRKDIIRGEERKISGGISNRL